ncbi:YceH family protein [Aquamicrobium segne]|uniref:YceH family protein n=1 Tax=Aquamicrobium segne TaxID=469547 RepID=A0ABW0GTE8_9HYPH
MDGEEFPALSALEARILGCLIEKKLLTPDVYPLTANALVAAANQKTAREPVMALSSADVVRGLKILEQKGLVRQIFASRVERYEHLMAQKFSLTVAQTALLGLLMLRGPQTLHELLARTERLSRFASAEELRGELDMLIGKRPPLVQEIGRAPGQREDRFVHLLCGPVDMAAFLAAPASVTVPGDAELEARLAALEDKVRQLTERLDALGA